MGTCSSLRRRMMMEGGKQEGILPHGYTRLQYIYNTNDAYINTGIAISNEDEIEFDYINVSPAGGDKALWGAKDSSSMYSWANMYGAIHLYLRWGGKVLTTGVENCKRVWIKDNVWYVYNNNGALITTWDSGAGTFQMNTTITLFGYHRENDVIQYTCKGVAISIFIIKNKWHGIPCKDSNNVVGMYDLVHRNFHTSPNGTAFIAGPLYE